MHLRNAIDKLKSGGGITIRSHILRWGANEISMEVHRDAWDILTCGGSKAKIGIYGVIREKVNGWIKIKLSMGNPNIAD